MADDGHWTQSVKKENETLAKENAKLAQEAEERKEQLVKLQQALAQKTSKARVVASAAEYEQDGESTDFMVPQFDRKNVRPRASLKYGGKLAIPDEIRDLLDRNQLHARWINQDDMGRHQEAMSQLGYEPLLQRGNQIVRQVSGATTACLMVTPVSHYKDAQRRKLDDVIDPTKKAANAPAELGLQPSEYDKSGSGTGVAVESPLR